MAWSAENATRAFLHTLKSGNKPMEPNVAEFISALAAGNNCRLIIEARTTPAGPTTLALLAAAQQTDGRVVCILSDPTHLQPSLHFLNLNTTNNNNLIQLIVGDASNLLNTSYQGAADFVLVDCEQERVFGAAQAGVGDGGLIVGCNALRSESSRSGECIKYGSLLPIGGGLRVCRVEAKQEMKRRSQWVVRVDESTGEEHVYRITPPSTALGRRKGIKA